MLFFRPLTVTYSIGFKLFCSSANILKKDLYYVLSLSSKASHADIKEAYYKLSLLYHPDRNKSVLACEKFREVSEAYEVLGNPILRRNYDKNRIAPKIVYTGHSKYKDGYDNAKFYESRRKSMFYRGKWDFYDFDEYYKKHYNHRRVLNKNDKEEVAGNDKESFEAIVVSFFCIFVMFFCLIDPTSGDRDVKKPIAK